MTETGTHDLERDAGAECGARSGCDKMSRMPLGGTGAALIGAGIGAAGAIAAQIGAAFAAHRTSMNRLSWEREQAQRSRFADLRRELFAQLLAVHSDYHNKAATQRYPLTEGERTELIGRWETQLKTISKLNEEIALVAPSVRKQCANLNVETIKMMTKVTEETCGLERASQAIRAYGNAIEECRVAMSHSLGVSS